MSDRITSAFRREMNNLLNTAEEKITEQGKKVIFLDCSDDMNYSAKAVVYMGEVPQEIQNCKNKYVKKNGKWYREQLLGKCPICGKDKELIMNNFKDKICFSCFVEQETKNN